VKDQNRGVEIASISSQFQSISRRQTPEIFRRKIDIDFESTIGRNYESIFRRYDVISTSNWGRHGSTGAEYIAKFTKLCLAAVHHLILFWSGYFSELPWNIGWKLSTLLGGLYPGGYLQKLRARALRNLKKFRPFLYREVHWDLEKVPALLHRETLLHIEKFWSLLYREARWDLKNFKLFKEEREREREGNFHL